MSGGLLQLVAFGAQDVYLTGSPQITFFKVVYRRHTNFAMECIEQTFNGSADWGKRVTCTISRNGDLIHRMYFVAKIPEVRVTQGSAFRWLDWLGHIMIKSVEIEIGGTRIDKHYGDWLHIWNELTQSAGHQTGYANMVGHTPVLNNVGMMPPVAWQAGVMQNDMFELYDDPSEPELSYPEMTLYIPLQFWFNRNPGLALPLIALQYHEVKIHMEINNKYECYWAGGFSEPVSSDPKNPSAPLTSWSIYTDPEAVEVKSIAMASLYVDYIYLDTDERRRFAQVSHEYLIEQLQFTGEESFNIRSPKVKLNFNHPTKELIWVIQREDVLDSSIIGGKQHFNYSDNFDIHVPAAINDVVAIEDELGMIDLIETPHSSELPHRALNNTTNRKHVTPTSGALSRPEALQAIVDWARNPSFPVRNAGSNFGLNWNVPKVGHTPGVAAGGANRMLTQSSFEGGINPVSRARLQLNGHDRVADRDGRYFNLVQPYQHHENVPSVGINVYSFALKPEEHQPSGTCNMSRIDNATLVLELTRNAVEKADPSSTGTTKINAKCRVYAVNYNVLRIMSGMGGLAYSN